MQEYNMDKYKKYTADNLLHDELFLRWMLLDSEEDNLFWREIVLRYPLLEYEINQAKKIYKSNVVLNNYKLDDASIDESLLALLESLRKARNKNKRRYFLQIASSVAALIAIILISVYYLNPEKMSEIPFSIEQARLTESTDILLLTKDTTYVLEDEVSMHSKTSLTNAIPIGEEVDFTLDKRKTEANHINKLVVPYGKRSFLLLADGSKVWVNSGTVVEFPTHFEENIRNIKVDGEIFIEVAEDKNKKFIVSTSAFNVEVLGTTFDVSSYKGDNSSFVVLVDGKVTVNNNGERTGISPNQQYIKTKKAVETNVVDVNDFVSWRLGWLQIKSHTLRELSIQLSRYYNINIQCDASIANRKASGKLRLFDNVEEVLKILSNNMNIKYELVGNKVIISNADL